MGRDLTAQRPGATMLEQACGQRTGPLLVGPERQVGGAGSPDRRGSRGSSTVGDLGEAGAEALVAGVDRPLAAGLGVLDEKQADIGQSELARIGDLDSDDLASTPEPGERRAPGVYGSDEVRDHDREPTARQDVPKTIDGAPEIDLSPERGSCNAAHETHQMPSTTADRHDPWPIGGRDHGTDAIAAEDGKPGHGRSDAYSQIGFPPADGPEVEAA